MRPRKLPLVRKWAKLQISVFVAYLFEAERTMRKPVFFYVWLAMCFLAIVPLWIIGWASYATGDRTGDFDEL